MKKLLLILLCFPMIGFGQCIEGDCENGYGIEGRHGPEGGLNDYDRYEGEWKNGQRHGQGVCSYSSPTATYKGEWKDDMYHGQGTLTGDYGYSYTGEWKNGKRHGKGTEICCEGADGPVIMTNGFWKEDEFIGERIK